jgi:hypothetical protein
LQPESKDALEGPEITEGVAQVYAILGDNDRAIEILDGLLNRPSYVTVPSLREIRFGIHCETIRASRL